MARSIGLFLIALALTAASARAQFTQVIGAGDFRQAVADGASTYVLKGAGEIWRFTQGQWAQIDNSSGTTTIAAANGVVYALKTDGSLYRYAFGGWSASGGGIAQAVAGGSNLFVLQTNSNIYRFDGASWTQLDHDTSGSKMIAADELGNVYVLKSDGHIYQF